MTELYKTGYIGILQKNSIDSLNSRITVIKHGIFLFMQYTEKYHIRNDLPEPLFWDLIGKLYCLLYDCSNNVFWLLIGSDDQYIEKRRCIFGDSLSQVNVGEIAEFIRDVKTMRIVKYHNMNMSDIFDSSRVNAVKIKLSEIAGVDGDLTKDEEWEKCVVWIRTKCNILYDFLQKMLEYIENSATDEQRKYLCDEYISAMEHYFDKNIRGILKNILLYKYRKAEDIANSYIKKYKKEIIEQTVMEIKQSSRLVNPYEMACQTAEVFLEENV